MSPAPFQESLCRTTACQPLPYQTGWEGVGLKYVSPALVSKSLLLHRQKKKKKSGSLSAKSENHKDQDPCSSPSYPQTLTPGALSHPVTVFGLVERGVLSKLSGNTCYIRCRFDFLKLCRPWTFLEVTLYQVLEASQKAKAVWNSGLC